MPNTSPQAVLVANAKIRPLSDAFGQLYNLTKSLQAQAAAENWPALFPAGAALIADGSDADGRTPITNDDVNAVIAIVATFITFMEQSSFANRNAIFKVAVNPER